MFPSGNTQGFTNGYFGPNFQFRAVPEPSTYAMLASGSLLLVGARALRGNKNVRH
jgi:hypothetical protein